MRGRQTARAIVANPILVGAVTVLVVVTAVFLAYNANKGLPFVPTYQFKVETPDAARLVVGNDVREGGFRIGQVTKIEPVKLDDGKTGATLTLQVEENVGPIPRDSYVIIRPRSALGLKYIDLRRGRERSVLAEGATLASLDPERTLPPELDDLFETFTADTRQDIRTNLETFGGGFAGRGIALNETLEGAPSFLRNLVPIMRTLSDPDTQLARLFQELGDAAALTAPVADDFAEGFTSMADTFEALSRDEQALKDFISSGPPTLRTGIEELPKQRPFLRRLANVSDEVQGAAREIRLSARPLAQALQVGTRVLPRTPRLNQDLQTSLVALRDFSRSPTTNMTLNGLTATNQTLNPTLQWAGPFVTVCNYWNYWWTQLADHISEEDRTGTLQRIIAKNAPESEDALAAMHANEPVNGEGSDPVTQRTFGDAPFFHQQQFGRAVTDSGEADCELGQRGYPQRLATGIDPKYKIVTNPNTPGAQGPTFTGLPRVPEGQTFSGRATGRSPDRIVGTP
jgi:virulence factor Mce-like protein